MKMRMRMKMKMKRRMMIFSELSCKLLCYCNSVNRDNNYFLENMSTFSAMEARMEETVSNNHSAALIDDDAKDLVPPNHDRFVEI